MNIKLTIGIPTFNRSDYLVESLQSCLAQTIPDGELLEIIVSDNHSTDGTQKYLEHVSKKNWGLGIVMQTLRQSKTVSPMQNWQNVLNSARGEFFLLLSDDDRLCENFYHNLLSVIRQYENETINGILGSFYKIDSKGKEISRYSQKNKKLNSVFFYEQLTTRKIRYHWCAFVSRTSCLQSYRVFSYDFLGSGMCADGAGILSCCASGGFIVTTETDFAEYRLHAGNDGASDDALTNIFESRDKFVFFAKASSASNRLINFTKYWCLDGLFYQCLKTTKKTIRDHEFGDRLNDYRKKEIFDLQKSDQRKILVWALNKKIISLILFHKVISTLRSLIS